MAELPGRRTIYNQIKRSAKKASRKHLDLVLDQFDRLESLTDSDLRYSDINGHFHLINLSKGVKT